MTPILFMSLGQMSRPLRHLVVKVSGLVLITRLSYCFDVAWSKVKVYVTFSCTLVSDL